MSDPATGAPQTAAEAAQAAKQEARFGAAFLRRHGWRLALVFAGLVLPLWLFGGMVDELHESEAFPFDVPILQFVHGLASAGYDRLFVVVSALGYQYGVIPLDIVLVVILALRRRLHEGLFAGMAIAGSALMNIAAKQSFARARPSLWQSIAPESSYSFPSGHAMGSMTLALVVVLLAWPTRWRWPVLAAAAAFALLVGTSRIYLGVHYPSDIIAGWAAASVWVVGVYGLVFKGHLRPWTLRRGQARTG